MNERNYLCHPWTSLNWTPRWSTGQVYPAVAAGVLQIPVKRATSMLLTLGAHAACVCYPWGGIL